LKKLGVGFLLFGLGLLAPVALVLRHQGPSAAYLLIAIEVVFLFLFCGMCWLQSRRQDRRPLGGDAMAAIALLVVAAIMVVLAAWRKLHP
jgi:peptidoglycan/LPS O-acetylase OafA/YrhL